MARFYSFGERRSRASRISCNIPSTSLERGSWLLWVWSVTGVTTPTRM